MKAEPSPELLVKIIDRAIVLVDRHTPVSDRNPTMSGGTVRATAVAFLVAARALVEAFVEFEKTP